jgi:hypothetical protein
MNYLSGCRFFDQFFPSAAATRAVGKTLTFSVSEPTYHNNKSRMVVKRRVVEYFHADCRRAAEILNPGIATVGKMENIFLTGMPQRLLRG